MRTGITGSRQGTTLVQALMLKDLMYSLRISEFHHGDCTGTDELGHDLALELKKSDDHVPPLPLIVVHPPDRDEHRAFCEGYDIIMDPLPCLKCNEAIAACDILVALPEGPEEQFPRSETWATVRRARKNRYPLIISIFPQGEVKFG